MIQLWRDAPTQFDLCAVCHLDGVKQPGETTRPTTARARSSSARCGARPATASYRAYVWRLRRYSDEFVVRLPSSSAGCLKFELSSCGQKGWSQECSVPLPAKGRRVLVRFLRHRPFNFAQHSLCSWGRQAANRRRRQPRSLYIFIGKPWGAAGSAETTRGAKKAP